MSANQFDHLARSLDLGSRRNTLTLAAAAGLATLLARSCTASRLTGRCGRREKNRCVDLSSTSGPTARPCDAAPVSVWLGPIIALEP